MWTHWHGASSKSVNVLQGEHATVYQQLLLCTTFSQLLPARVPSGKRGACKVQLSISEHPKAADRQVDIPAH